MVTFFMLGLTNCVMPQPPVAAPADPAPAAEVLKQAEESSYRAGYHAGYAAGARAQQRHNHVAAAVKPAPAVQDPAPSGPPAAVAETALQAASTPPDPSPDPTPDAPANPAIQPLPLPPPVVYAPSGPARPLGPADPY